MPEDSRPNPDALLADITAAEAERSEGRLKIFLGMCPGVGKTYAMLLAGQAKQEDGVDVVIGLLETHGRVETVAVAAGRDGFIPPPPSARHGVVTLRSPTNSRPKQSSFC